MAALTPAAAALTKRALGVAAIGGAGFAVACAIDLDRALAAYLVAWIAAMLAAVGALFVQCICYAANARWPATIRRVLDAIGSAIAPLAVLALPLVVGASRIWPWIEPSPSLAAAIAPRRAWLDPLGFALRSALYLAVWIVAAELLRAWGRRRDRAPQARTDNLDRERGAASALIAPIFLTLTFAAFDWLMTLEPTWLSSAFGLYAITAALCAGLSVVVIATWRLADAGALALAPSHFHALGRLLLAFVALWGYIGYFQAFLIQIADLPDEVTFYIARTHGTNAAVTWLLVVLHLALPLPLLFARRWKFDGRYIGAIAIGLCVAHALDMWWLIVPSIAPGALPSWCDLAALALVGGAATAAVIWRARGASIVAVGDPFLETGLAYRSAR